MQAGDRKQVYYKPWPYIEAFATGIKIESSDQSPFGRPIKGSRWPQNCKKQVQGHTATIWPLTLGNQVIKSVRKERWSNQVHFLLIKKLDRSHKCFNRWHISDYPLIMADHLLVPCTQLVDQGSEHHQKSCRTLSLIPRPHSLMRRNGLGEPSQISWASTCFCDSVT